MSRLAIIKLYRYLTTSAIQLPSEPPQITRDTSPSKPTHSPTFDLGLAKFSLLIEIAVYVCVPFAPTVVLFTVLSVVASFSAGFAPALQSVALDLYARREGGTETGRLFGAFSVVQAIT